MAMVHRNRKKHVCLLLTCYCYFLSRDYVPAADDRRYLTASGKLRTGSLIPEQISWDHWKLALGLAWNRLMVALRHRHSRYCCGLELGKGRRDFRDWHCGALHHCAYAFARMRFPGKATLLKGI